MHRCYPSERCLYCRELRGQGGSRLGRNNLEDPACKEFSRVERQDLKSRVPVRVGGIGLSLSSTKVLSC
jgi:hypothetical protein